MGGSRRLLVKDRLRFNSSTSTSQIAPMAKQAGDWFVWMDDEGHFRYAQQDPDGTRLVRVSDPIAVAGPTAGSGGSAAVKSFALIYNEDFDADNLWVYWVDWSTNAGAQQNRDAVWAMKIPLDWTAPTQMNVYVGTSSNLRIFTGVSATYVDGSMWIAACGVYLSVGTAVDFRSNSAGQIDGLSKHFTVDSSGNPSSATSYVRTSTARSWCASGICWLTNGDYSFTSGHAYYAFWTQNESDRTLCDLVMIDVTTATGSAADTTIASIALDTEAKPDILTLDHNYIGQVSGREDSASLIYIVGSVRVSNANNGALAWTDINTTVKADRVYTQCYGYIPGLGAGVLWTGRGSWLACGPFRRSSGSGEFIVTGYHDADEVQMCYHLREFETGNIVCQFLYGRAAFAGGCGSSYKQIEAHVSDIHQPYLSGADIAVVLPTSSVNVSGTCDISALEFSRPS